MSKKEKKAADKNIIDTTKQATSEYNVAQAAEDERLNRVYGENQANRKNMSGIYTDMMNKPGGQVDTGRLAGVYDSASQFGQTGGYSPEREASIMENVQGLKEMGRTGGLDEEAINRFRGNGVYDEFVKTGGIDEPTRNNIRQTTLAPIAGYAKSAQDELDRRRMQQGGYAPGFDSAARAIRRDSQRDITDAAMRSELNISDAVNKGRQWGATGMTTSENALQTLKTGNQLKGMTSAADIETTLQNSINQFRMQGMSLASATAKAIADVDQGNIENTQNQQRFGVQGLQGLYDEDIAMETDARSRRDALMNDEYRVRMGLSDQQREQANMPGMGAQLALAGVSAAGGALGSYLGRK